MRYILRKVIVNKFYTQNSGFFLFFILVLFGLMNARDMINLHFNLMLSIASKWIGWSIFSSICILYAIKCVFFIKKQFFLKENQFLKELRILSIKSQIIEFLLTSFFIYAPVLTYALITITIGIINKFYLFSILTLLVQILIILFIINKSQSYLNNPFNDNKSPTFISKIPFISNQYNFSLRNLWFTKKTALIFIKVSSLVLFQFLVILNNDNVRKENFCFVTLLSVSTHAQLPFFTFRFWEYDLPDFRQLPISILKRISFWIPGYVILLLPEFLFMIINNPDHVFWGVLFSYYFMGIAQLILFTSIQYVPGMNYNKYMGLVLIMFFANMIITAGLNVFVYSFILILIALILFAIFYNKYERVYNETISR